MYSYSNHHSHKKALGMPFFHIQGALGLLPRRRAVRCGGSTFDEEAAAYTDTPPLDRINQRSPFTSA